MSVTDLADVRHVTPATRLLRTEAAPREDRADELNALAEIVTLGVTPSPRSLRLQVCAWSCDRLMPREVMARWDDFVSEVRRVQAVEAGEPYFRDLQPGLAHADCAAALADLLDGTDTYRGERTGGVS